MTDDDLLDLVAQGISMNPYDEDPEEGAVLDTEHDMPLTGGDVEMPLDEEDPELGATQESAFDQPLPDRPKFDLDIGKAKILGGPSEPDPDQLLDEAAEQDLVPQQDPSTAVDPDALLDEQAVTESPNAPYAINVGERGYTRETFEPRPAPAPQQWQGAMATQDPNGKRPDIYGMEDDVEKDHEGQGQAAFDAASARPRAQQMPSDDDLMNGLLDPKHIHIMHAIASLGGNAQAANASVAPMMQRYQTEQQALMHARNRRHEWQKDHDDTPVSPAEAAAIRQFGGLPENAAVNMPRNSPVMKSFGNWAGQSMQMRKLDQQMALERMKEVGKTGRHLGSEGGQDARALLNANTNIEAAQLRKRQKSAGGGSADPQRMMAAILVDNHGMTPEEAEGYAANPNADVSKLPQRVQQAVYVAREAAQQIARDPKKVTSFWASAVNREGGVTDSTARSANNATTNFKSEKDYNNEAAPLAHAMQAYMRLQKSGGLAEISKFGDQGWFGALKKARLSAEQQQDASAIKDLIGAWAHKRYGAAFTSGEQQQVTGTTGINFGSGVDPFVNPAVIGGFLKRYKQVLEQHRAALERNYGANRQTVR
jgi:hypothetical protein